MAKFSLKDSSEHYIELSETPKRFDADSPVTNVFFDDTNGQASFSFISTYSSLDFTLLFVMVWLIIVSKMVC